MSDIRFGVISGAAKETFLAVELDAGEVRKVWFMSESEFRDSLEGIPEPQIEATIRGARQHPV